jgi:hypothetical protein
MHFDKLNEKHFSEKMKPYVSMAHFNPGKIHPGQRWLISGDVRGGWHQREYLQSPTERQIAILISNSSNIKVNVPDVAKSKR